MGENYSIAKRLNFFSQGLDTVRRVLIEIMDTASGHDHDGTNSRGVSLTGAGITASADELNLNDGAIAGTAVPNKTLALGATKNINTLLFDVAAPGAAGNSQGTATAMTADTNFVTGADGAKGVKLPVAVAGRRLKVKNTVENQILKVYPATDAAVNALAANAAISLPAGCQCEFLALSATQWYVSAVPDGITSTADELNKLDGASANVTATNLNSLTGGSDVARAAGGHGHVLAAGASDVSITAANLNALDDGSDIARAVGGHGHALAAGASDVTITAGNINALDDGGDIARAAGGHGHQLAAGASDVTASAAEVNLNDGALAGSAVANKTLALGAAKNVDTLLFDAAAPGAAGNSQGTATAMTADTNFVTGANGTAGVALPVAVVGRRITVKNTVDNAALKVYPGSGAAINNGPANAAVSLPGGAQIVFSASTSLLWQIDSVTLSGARSVVTFNAHQFSVAALDTNNRLELDFSAHGIFADVCFVAAAVADGQYVIVQEDLGQKSTGKVALIVYVASEAPYTPYGTYGGALDVELTVTLAGNGWTGATTGPFAGTWTAPHQI